jgi:adenosylcobinamide kinase/adenosylcobinamide-phosphate guanylyltransferase
MTAVSAAAYDVVLLEESFGTKTDHGTGHLDLTTFPAQVAALREAGAIVDGTDLVAVHLSHHNPPDLARILEPWGARVVDDLTTLTTDGPRALAPRPRRQLVLGGARSGKSHEAERRLLAHPSVTYLATGGERADDPEWRARVAVHRARRSAAWRTVETLDVASTLAAAGSADAVLVDCVALWLAGRLDAARTWDVDPGTPAYAESLVAVTRDCDALVTAMSATTAHVVLVSNEVGGGVVPEHASGRLYRDLLGVLNRRLAEVCDDVDLVVAGRVLRL